MVKAGSACDGGSLGMWSSMLGMWWRQVWNGGGVGRLGMMRGEG